MSNPTDHSSCCGNISVRDAGSLRLSHLEPCPSVLSRTPAAAGTVRPINPVYSSGRAISSLSGGRRGNWYEHGIHDWTMPTRGRVSSFNAMCGLNNSQPGFPSTPHVKSTHLTVPTRESSLDATARSSISQPCMFPVSERNSKKEGSLVGEFEST